MHDHCCHEVDEHTNKLGRTVEDDDDDDDHDDDDDDDDGDIHLAIEPLECLGLPCVHHIKASQAVELQLQVGVDLLLAGIKPSQPPHPGPPLSPPRGKPFSPGDFRGPNRFLPEISVGRVSLLKMPRT